MKLKVTEEKLLKLMLKYNGGRPRSEVIIFTSTCFILLNIFCYSTTHGLVYLLVLILQTKLKSAVQLQDLLDATRMLVPRTRYHSHLEVPLIKFRVKTHPHCPTPKRCVHRCDFLKCMV